MGGRMTHPPYRLSRRRFVGLTGAATATALLPGCGIGTGGTARNESEEAGGSFLPPKSGELSVANWPLYIDKAKGTSPTVQKFEKRTGIDTTYKEVIQDYESFYATLREPLSRGEPTGWDVIVIGDWLVPKMARLGYLEELHHQALPNFRRNAGAAFVDRPFDPGNRHSVPWQGGFTGIAYDPELTGREITSFADLLDPEFKGRVGMLKEMRETMGLALLHLGVEPTDATEADAKRAQEVLLKQRDSGVLRAYYGQNYVDALVRGDVALTMGWAADVFQLQLDNPRLRFAVPKEGGILWLDNFAIPAGARHPTDAHAWIDFVYRPRIAANITEWVGAITPVEPAQEVIARDARRAEGEDAAYLRRVATDPLIFPTEEMLKLGYSTKPLTPEEEEVWNQLFDEVLVG
jgi:spermidine/putrescine transport system substrate-binding protein